MTILLSLLRQFWPYIAAFMLGASMAGGAAWQVQGLRITAAEQEFTDYKQEQTRLIQEAKDAADKQRTDAAEEYARLRHDLGIAIQTGDSYRRCVAAGKCGRLSNLPACSGSGLSAPRNLDGAGGIAIPLAGEAEAPGLVTDCAYTTLQLNQLQQDIENQPGFKE